MRLRTLVSDVMTRDPVFATPEASVEVVAKMMVAGNCGEIPICDNGKVLGIVTDRDITCRTVARGIDAAKTRARDVMTVLPVTVEESEPVARAVALMKTERLRRLPVVNAHGTIVGIISQVDIAARSSRRRAGELLAVSGDM